MNNHQWGDKEYLVRRLAPHIYQVAVFTDSPTPDNLYIVSGLSCSCPAGGGAEHKHVKIVEKFIDLGEEPLSLFWFDKEGRLHARANTKV